MAVATWAALGLAACGASSPRTGPSEQTVATVPTCDGAASAEAVITAADEPRCTGGTWTFTLPAMTDPPEVRRSEVLLKNGRADVSGQEGSTVVHDVSITPHLGDAGQGDGSWHVLWQLQGKTDEKWGPPSMGLRIRHGVLAVSGGSGHPEHNWTLANYEWAVDLTKVTDGETYRIRVSTYLSSDPDRGWVSASVDGRTIIDHWRPVSPDGLRSGTIYPGQPTVDSRIGLYRGSQTEAPPTYGQNVNQQVFQARSY